MSIAEALVDLDHFKDINDTLGHEGGDDLPKSVARRIEGAVKRGDVVARIGGDEFDALMARGFSIAIDDFGVGFASLAYLCDFRCQQIKIDRSFLCAPGDLSRSRRLIRALVARAVELDIGVTAEGVETTEQAAFLRGIGCHSGQGYLFAPAVPIPSLAPMLARGFARSDGWSDV
jgi:predicted signal transduction protein with EAL and GGDEF domain